MYLKLQHDDNIEVYINGKQVYKTTGWTGKFIYIPIDDAHQILRQGKNMMAIHIANTAGGAWLDAGIVLDPPQTMETHLQTANQKSCTVSATQTTYKFSCGGVDLDLIFTSPLLLNDLNLISRPVSYITYKVQSHDGENHDVQVYFGASTNIA